MNSPIPRFQILMIKSPAKDKVGLTAALELGRPKVKRKDKITMTMFWVKRLINKANTVKIDQS